MSRVKEIARAKIIGRLDAMEGRMRWKVLLGLFVFAASITGLIGVMAGPVQAGGGSSIIVTLGSQNHSGWRGHGGYRDVWRHHHRPRHYHGRKARHVFQPRYWPRPWPAPPRVIYVDPPREIATKPSSTPKPYCREFQKQIIIDGRTEQAYGEACLQPDGIWKIQP